jgi:hypothetical protein
MFAGWGDTSEVSENGKEGLVAELILENFQNYL